jgi:hypothetical protein
MVGACGWGLLLAVLAGACAAAPTRVTPVPGQLDGTLSSNGSPPADGRGTSSAGEEADEESQQGADSADAAFVASTSEEGEDEAAAGDTEDDPARDRPWGISTSVADHAVPLFDAHIISVRGGVIFQDHVGVQTWWEDHAPTRDLYHERTVPPDHSLEWLPRLGARLAQVRSDWVKANPGETFPGDILLDIDSLTPVGLLSGIVQTAAAFGYPHGMLVVHTRRGEDRLGLLPIEVPEPQSGWEFEREGSVRIELLILSSSAVKMTWWDGERLLGWEPRVVVADLEGRLIRVRDELVRLLPRYEEDAIEVSISSPADTRVSALVPIVDAIQVPQRTQRSDTGEVVSLPALSARLTPTDEQAALLRATWPEARATAMKLADEMSRRARTEAGRRRGRAFSPPGRTAP